MLKKESCFAHASGDYRHATSKFFKKSECFCTYRTKGLHSDLYENIIMIIIIMIIMIIIIIICWPQIML